MHGLAVRLVPVAFDRMPVLERRSPGSRRVKGIELPTSSSRTTKRAGTVGGVRGRGR